MPMQKPVPVAPVAAPDCTSLLDYMRACCQRFGPRTAFVQQDEAIDYATLWAHGQAFAGHLQQHGVAAGDRVAVMLPNVIAFPLAAVAIQIAGAVQVNVNPFYVARELHHQLMDADVATLVVSEVSLAALAEADVPCLRHVIVTDTSAAVARAMLPHHLAVTSLAEALDAGHCPQELAQEPRRDDLAVLQYTGGTTGISKGAMLSHDNLLSNVAQFRALAEGHFDTDSAVVLTAIPLYHIFAFTANMLTLLASGGKNVLIRDPRDLDLMAREWQTHRVTFITGVNTLYKALVGHAGFAQVDFAPELIGMGGGSAIQPVASERWKALTGKHIRQGYGLSETSPILTCNPFAEDSFRGSIGIALPDTDIVIRDTEDRDLPDGEIGELCARGPQVMAGYWRRPDATAQVMTHDGYFRTGDLARRDADGHFHIVDRQKDMILVSGFNVYPNEVEAAVAMMEAVAECACVGIPDTRSGEAVVLYVVRRDPALDALAIEQHCRTNLAPYKVPRRIVFIDAIPKTAVGKLLRRDLRERAEAEFATPE